ncbi:unnamed protein product [Anisakis simplex]|uniref:Uncharacterized protein n=1 Tax=Anisakis simplex TaxID=6269 RepID=A0A3P6QK39_ANISI|nr:unnamed protein product [Anisakis simplex]
MPCKVIFSLFFLLPLAYSTKLYRFGPDEADQDKCHFKEISYSSEPSAVTLDVPIVYFEETQNAIYISSNGIVSFGKPIEDDQESVRNLDDERINAIAVFYVPTSGGTIYYRSIFLNAYKNLMEFFLQIIAIDRAEPYYITNVRKYLMKIDPARATSSDNDLLNDLSDRINRNFPTGDSGEFRALHAILITWDDVSASDADGLNQYQLAIATDGLNSYAVFIYNRIDWTTSHDKIAQAGLYFSDGRRQSMVNSGTPNIRELINYSNNQKEGSYIFRISGGSPEDPRVSDVDEDYSYNDYEAEYNPDEEFRRPQQPSANCPPDPYRYSCPTECEVLTDDRGCSLCICTQSPAYQPSTAQQSPNDITNSIATPVQSYQYVPVAYPGESPTQPEDAINRVDEAPRVSYGGQQGSVSGSDIHQFQPNKPIYSSVDHPIPQPRQPPSDIEQHIEIADTPSRVDSLSHSTSNFGQDRDMALSCAQASETIQPCHDHARCIDYNPGYCCQCLDGYYGNGKECLRNGNPCDPQRINGYFEGVINGEEIGRTDLHTYVMTAEGRAYMALSQIPAHLGRSLLLLNPIGSAMGWLFAKVESPSSYNGFQLTGGLFNRTINVHIGDRSAVTIKQQFSGRDIHHYFKANIFVTGTLPQLAEGVQVIYPDHEEEYRREGPGFVRSYSSLDVLVNEHGQERTIRLTIDQQIHFAECPYKTFSKDSIVVVKVTRPHVVYDTEERIVRYASANAATSERSHIVVEEATDEGQEQQQQISASGRHLAHEARDPCAEGHHLCTLPNMFCTRVDPSYRCECQKGYQTMPDASTHLGWKCIDLNECDRGDHTCDRNAVCTNTDGSFKCDCRPGYEGDGFQCYSSEQPSKGGCHSHQECHQWGECVFGHNGHPGHCKCRGWYVGDGVKHCGPPEEQPRVPEREEIDENLCGGYTCDANADCITVQSGGEQCVCRRGFYGNGVQCEQVADTMRPAVHTVSVGSVCRSHDECGEHGNCVYGNDVGFYRCVCVPPYKSDGTRCVQDETQDIESVQMSCDLENICDLNADCVFERGPDDEGYYRCICRPGFTGDGIRCIRTTIDHIPFDTSEQEEVLVEQQYCDTLHNCDVNAECIFDPQIGHYICRCMPNFEGDGYSCPPIHPHLVTQPPQPTDVRRSCHDASDCHRNAHCVVRENSFEYFCECLPGFKGDGVNVCKSADECNPTDPQTCHEHAECVYGQVESAFVCKCIQGYVGDGLTCTPQARPPSCDQEPTVCHMNAQCIYNTEQDKHICICQPGSIGDGYNSCEIQDAPRCGRCSTFARCVQQENGAWSCECNPGYQGNGHVCSALSSCLDDPSICDPNAECVPGGHGQYVCNCHYGYHGNGRTCTPDTEGREQGLLIGRGMTVIQRGTNPDIHGKQSELQSPEGIVVDWSSRNVYYADSVKDEIGVATLDGKYQKALITEGLVNPRALAIDLRDRHLYYSDWHRENPLIGRVDLDGRNNKVFINTDLNLPNGLTILQERRELCWVDAGMQRLSCIGLDGHNRRVVFAPLEYPFGLTNHNEQRFYWTDWKDNQIHSVSIYGDGYTSFPPTMGGTGRLYGIMSVPLQCKGTANGCAVNNGGCQYMCLPGTTQVRCACPDNVQDLEGCS